MKVTDTSFRLGDIAALNRYLCAAGGSRPAGTLIASQLPNLKGGVEIDAHVWGSYSSLFYVDNHNTDGSAYANGTAADMFRFDASRYSSIYKDDVTQVFGDAFTCNLFIKALNLVP